MREKSFFRQQLLALNFNSTQVNFLKPTEIYFIAMSTNLIINHKIKVKNSHYTNIVLYLFMINLQDLREIKINENSYSLFWYTYSLTLTKKKN